jgi:3-oxoacyl-[acyl-carrier protein] reductase
MDLGLKGKVAVVTGSSRGIGKGIALGLAAEGCNLVICARGEEALRATAKEIEAEGSTVLMLPLDVTQKETANQIVRQTKEIFGRLDILVNNVGLNRPMQFEATTDEDWDELLNLNLMCHIRMSRVVIPVMREHGEGVILFISSIYGREAGGPNLSLYNTTKSGLVSVAKIMALELASANIRVNSIAPGSIHFPGGVWDRRCRENPEGMAEFVKREMPLGRFGTVEEVANVAVFLASPRASLMTGACINVDGCQSHSLI